MDCGAFAEDDGDVVVFGSAYRTAAGHIAPCRSAQILLEGGPAALAIAPADYRSHRDPWIRTVGLLADLGWPSDSILDLGDVDTALATEHAAPLFFATAMALGTPTFNISISR